MFGWAVQKRHCHCTYIFLEGHLYEIKEEIFNENYTNAQTYVLDCLGVVPSSPHNLRDVAATILQRWLTTLFLTSKPKPITSGNETLNTVV